MAAASARVAARTTMRDATSDNALDRRDEMLGVDAEELVDVGRRRRLAEAVDADHFAVEPHVLAPIIGNAGLDRHARQPLRQDALAPRRILAVEDAGARHGDDAHRDAGPGEPLLSDHAR